MAKKKADKPIKDSIVKQYHDRFSADEGVFYRTLVLYCANTPAAFRRADRTRFVANDVYNDVVKAINDNLKKFGEAVKEKTDEEISDIKKTFKFLAYEEYSTSYTTEKETRKQNICNRIIEKNGILDDNENILNANGETRGKLNWYYIGDVSLPRGIVEDQIKMAFNNHEQALQTGGRVRFRSVNKMRSFGFGTLNGVKIEYCGESKQFTVSFNTNLAETFNTKSYGSNLDINSVQRKSLLKKWEKSGINIPRERTVFKSKAIKSQMDHVEEYVAFGQMYNVRIVKKNGRYYIHIGFKFQKKIDKSKTEVATATSESRQVEIVGIDVGITNPVVTSDGKYYKSQEDMLRIVQHIDSLKSRASILENNIKNGQRGSRKHLKHIKRNITVQSEKLADKRSYNAHCISKEMTENHSVIAREDLQLAKMAEYEHKNTGKIKQKNGLTTAINRGMRNVAPGQLFNYLEYKAQAKGGIVLAVNPYNTSQECSGCGQIAKKDLRVREHNCPHCGLKIERDYNAAINIKKRGLLVLDEILQFKAAIEAGDESAVKKYQAYLRRLEKDKIGSFKDMHKRKSVKENADNTNGVEIPRGIEASSGRSTDESRGMVLNHSGRCDNVSLECYC